MLYLYTFHPITIRQMSIIDTGCYLISKAFFGSHTLLHFIFFYIFPHFEPKIFTKHIIVYY